MNSLYLTKWIRYLSKDLQVVLANGPMFCIGVKNSEIDLDMFLEKFPSISVVTRFDEVINPRYLHEESKEKHILQPAILKWEP
jgi:hypothetical protein